MPIYTKKQLYTLYAKKYSRRKIRQAINQIVAESRPHRSNHCHRLMSREYQQFVQLYGEPPKNQDLCEKPPY